MEPPRQTDSPLTLEEQFSFAYMRRLDCTFLTDWHRTSAPTVIQRLLYQFEGPLNFGDACVNELERLCLTSKTLPDWHYDVVALHPSSKIDEVALGDLRRWGSSGYTRRFGRARSNFPRAGTTG